MNPAFNSEALQTDISGLSALSKLAIGLLALERSLPGYYAFLAELKLRDQHGLRSFAASCWGLIEGVGGKALPVLREEVFDSENFSSIFTTSAMDAVSIAHEMSEFWNANIDDKIVSCCSLRVDTVDVFLQNLNPLWCNRKDLEELILCHPLMQKELSDQRADVDAFSDAESSREEIFTVAVKRIVEASISNDGLVALGWKKQ